MLEISLSDTKNIIKSLKSGLVVALPTETVYGLAISLNSATALEKLIYLKRREIGSGKVFTLVPESKNDIKKYAVANKIAQKLISQHIPGEITLILPKNPEFHHPYFDHFKTIGIRIPDYPLFSQILLETGPLLLTSANPRGGTPANTSEEVAKLLPKVDAIVTGKSGQNPPSTIVDCTTSAPKVVREGNLKPVF